MTMESIIEYLLQEAPVVVAVGFAAYFVTSRLGKKHTAEVVQEARLANSIDALTTKLDEAISAIKHMDHRLDNHELDIALLKQGQAGRECGSKK